MKKMLAALALALTLPTCALGDSEGVIVQSSCNIVQSGDYYLAYCFAQVHNNASTVICLDQGPFDLQSGETLPMGRSYYKAFQSAFVRYINQ